MNKLTTYPEILNRIQPGSSLALGGMTLYRRPMAFVWELLKHARQQHTPTDLQLIAFTASIESDLLVGANLISSVRSCYFGMEIFGLAPMFTYHANRGTIHVIEETEASLAFGLRAQMAGIGFMPGRGWIGTDLPRLRPDVKTIIDPYTGENLMAFPAIQPDIAVIHAIKADPEGNAQIGGNKGVDVELSITSQFVIITAEEIVPELDQADLVAPFVDAVVLAENGARPTSCHPLYTMDGEMIMEYIEQVSDPDNFESYIQKKLRAN